MPVLVSKPWPLTKSAGEFDIPESDYKHVTEPTPHAEWTRRARIYIIPSMGYILLEDIRVRVFCGWFVKPAFLPFHSHVSSSKWDIHAGYRI